MVSFLVAFAHGWVSASSLPCVRSSTAQRASLRLVELGSTLPLPLALCSLEGVPASCGTLDELAGGRELLVLASSDVDTMTDPLRTVLVGLQGVVRLEQHYAQAAAVSLVGAATYRKLVRKAGVSYTLLCDSGSREWLSQLHDGPAASGAVSVHIVAMRSAKVLARFTSGSPTGGGGTGGLTAQEVVGAVSAALSQGRERLEAEVDARVQARSAHADLAALRAENERLQAELAATAGKRLAEARAAARAEERGRLQAEADAANAASAARAAAAEAEASTKKDLRAQQQRQRQQEQGSSKVAKAQLRASPRQAAQRRAAAQRSPEPKAERTARLPCTWDAEVCV